MHLVKAFAATLVAGLALAGPIGCADTPDNPGWEYGKSYHTMFENQKANPQAGAAGEPVEGMNATKSTVIYDRYEKDTVGASEKKAGLKMETTVSQ